MGSFGRATSRRHKRDLLSAAAIVRLGGAGVNGFGALISCMLNA